VTVAGRLTALLGPDAVDTAAAPPLARPQSIDAAAAVVRVAHEAGWRIRIQGTGSWIPPDAPADLALATGGLVRMTDLAPDDLVATVEAGIGLDALDGALAESGVWLPLDPPGSLRRSLGSIVATGTWGALRQGFGPIRDHLLGVTAIIGDGSIVRAGGRVVKNVAGYDLSRAIAGSFGAFGIIVELHMRLRVRPRADTTWIVTGARDDLFEMAIALAATTCRPTAFEIVSPATRDGTSWTLALRLTGAPPAVEADTAIIRSVASSAAELQGAPAAAFWQDVRKTATRTAVTLRIGALPDGVESTLEEVEHALGEAWATAGPAHGGLRWSGEVAAPALSTLRRHLAAREIPLAIERAPWPVRSSVGHFGAYREGVPLLTRELKRAFDPGDRFVVPLGES